MVYKHAYLNTLLLLHSAFMLSVVKMPLKRGVGGHALNSNGNYIVDHGKSWKNHGIVFLNFGGNLNRRKGENCTQKICFPFFSDLSSLEGATGYSPVKEELIPEWNDPSKEEHTDEMDQVRRRRLEKFLSDNSQTSTETKHSSHED